MIESVKAEDNSRELYTLDTAKADLVQLPTFEGRVDEDFAKFKDEVEDAFIQNRVSKSNKFKKLREVLKGHAKKLVPESLTGSIDEAWEVLDKAFGNPQRLMNYRRDTLLKLGPLPKASVKDGDKAQVEWYLQVETSVKGIIELGKKSVSLDRTAFNDNNIGVIIKMFPRHLQDKLMECEGQGVALLDAILKKIIEFRKKAQKHQILEENTTNNAPIRGKINITS